MIKVQCNTILMLEELRGKMIFKMRKIDYKRGAGVLEVILITVVLLGLALIFRKQIFGIFQSISGELQKLGDSVDNIKFSDKVN